MMGVRSVFRTILFHEPDESIPEHGVSVLEHLGAEDLNAFKGFLDVLAETLGDGFLGCGKGFPPEMVEVGHGADVVEVGAFRLTGELFVHCVGEFVGVFGVGGCGVDLLDEVFLVLGPCLLVGSGGEEAGDTGVGKVFTC